MTQYACQIGKRLCSPVAGEGASLVAIEDSGALITATDVEGALAENRTAIDTAEADIATNTASIVAIEGREIGIRTITVLHSDLTEAVNGTAEAVNIGAALPANAVVMAHELDITTLFSGGTVSAVTVDVGGTDPDAIVNGHDVFTGAATGKLTGSTLGVHSAGLFSSEQLVITFTPDAGNPLVDLDAGELDVTVWYAIPPTS